MHHHIHYLMIFAKYSWLPNQYFLLATYSTLHNQFPFYRNRNTQQTRFLGQVISYQIDIHQI